MKIKVTKNQVILEEGYIVNRGEYNANPLEFEFSEEYTSDLVKKAIFESGNIRVEQAIINNGCNIPYEVLNVDSFNLRVYAYEVDNEELILRYSPTYATVYLRIGSYITPTGSGEEITPTQFEQYEQALNDGLAEAQNVDIDISKVDYTTTVTITNRQGQEKSEDILDGIGLQYDWQNTSLGVKREDEENYTYVDLQGDCNFATFEINNNMELVMNKTEDMLLDFGINEEGFLYVII